MKKEIEIKKYPLYRGYLGGKFGDYLISERGRMLSLQGSEGLMPD